jgi:DNA polymerase
MNKIIIDFETKSTVNLLKAGIWAYAEHPTTDILCIGYKLNDSIELWTPQNGIPFMLKVIDNNGYIFAAHNAEFERAIWHHICHKRWGWPDIPLKQWRCIAAKAAALSMPRSLDGVAKALGLIQQKDKKGHALMLKMCKPRKPLKSEKVAWLNGNVYGGTLKSKDASKSELEYAEKNIPLLWHEKQEDLERLYMYCKQDIRTEYEVDRSLRDLSVYEQNLWFVDQMINQRGVHIDVEGIRSAIKVRDRYEKILLNEFNKLTTLNSPRQVAETVCILQHEGLNIEDLTKQTVETQLDRNDISNYARRILELRQSLSLSSVAKLDAMTRGLSEDDRAKSLMLFCGSHTGRWAGKRIQPQNMPRSTIPDVDYFIELLKDDNQEALQMLWGGDLYFSLSSSIRSFITAKPGYDLVCADFSAIEARVLAWLAKEDHVIAAFENGLDSYKVAASGIFKKHYDDITKEERSAGKIADLALGYQGALNAYKKMAAGYKVFMKDSYIDSIVKGWRADHPRTKRFWSAMEKAAIRAVKTGLTQTYNGITWGKVGDWLFCKLPSGRFMTYYKPQIIEKMMSWGKSKMVLSYMGVDSMTKKWREHVTYGGKLVENIVQAVARDILAEAIVRVDAAGYPVVLHVHDEIVAEILKSFGSLTEFENLVAVSPEWATGCPIDAKGWRGERYRKE